MTLPIIEKCKLGELPDEADPVRIAALMHPWEVGFLEDVQHATEDAEARKTWSAYQVNDDLGGVQPFMVDYHPGGGHMLSSDATVQFIRLNLISFEAMPPCDCELVWDDEDDEWGTGPGECTCCDQGIRLSNRGRAVLAAAGKGGTK